VPGAEDDGAVEMVTWTMARRVIVIEHWAGSDRVIEAYPMLESHPAGKVRVIPQNLHDFPVRISERKSLFFKEGP
jgi:hypothetical protein